MYYNVDPQQQLNGFGGYYGYSAAGDIPQMHHGGQWMVSPTNRDQQQYHQHHPTHFQQMQQQGPTIGAQPPIIMGNAHGHPNAPPHHYQQNGGYHYQQQQQGSDMPMTHQQVRSVANDGHKHRANVYGQQFSPTQQQPPNGQHNGNGRSGHHAATYSGIISGAATTDGATTTYANVFVNRLPDGITHSDLLQIFSAFDPKSATVMTDHKTGKSKGFGFIQFNSDEDGKNAHQSLHHKTVEVRGNSFVIRAFPSKHDANQSVEVSPVLYVRNVPKSVPKAQVEAMLESLGSVQFCAMREEPDGLPVWVILVEYDCQQCADNALSHLRINTSLYPDHRAVIAKYAKPMDRKRHEPKANAVPCPFKNATCSKDAMRVGESSCSTTADAYDGTVNPSYRAEATFSHSKSRAKPGAFVVTTSPNNNNTCSSQANVAPTRGTRPTSTSTATRGSGGALSNGPLTGTRENQLVYLPTITSPHTAPLAANFSNPPAIDTFAANGHNNSSTSGAAGGSALTEESEGLGSPIEQARSPLRSSNGTVGITGAPLPATTTFTVRPLGAADRLAVSGNHNEMGASDIALPGFNLAGANDEGSPLDNALGIRRGNGGNNSSGRGSSKSSSAQQQQQPSSRRPRADSGASTVSDASRAATVCNSSGIFSFNSAPPTMANHLASPLTAHQGMMTPQGTLIGMSTMQQVPYYVVVDSVNRNHSFGGEVQLGHAVMGTTHSGVYTAGGLTPTLGAYNSGSALQGHMDPATMLTNNGSMYNPLLMSTDSQNPMGMSAGGACGSEMGHRSRGNSFSFTSQQGVIQPPSTSAIRHFVPTSTNGIISPTQQATMASMGGMPPLFMPASPLHDSIVPPQRSTSAHSNSMSTSNIGVGQVPQQPQTFSPYMQQQHNQGPIIYFQSPVGGQHGVSYFP